MATKIEVFQVAGPIGTGKSTLVRSAIAAGLVGAVEFISKELIAKYVANPTLYAEILQQSAMHGAVIRTDLALKMNPNSMGKIVVERAAQENIIFAVANRDAKYMTDAQFQSYKDCIRPLLKLNEELLQNTTIYNSFIWCAEAEHIQRMINRGDAAEQAYVDEYLEHYANCNFRAVLESHLPETADLSYRILPFVVVDWTDYKDWTQFENFVKGNTKHYEPFVAVHQGKSFWYDKSNDKFVRNDSFVPKEDSLAVTSNTTDECVVPLIHFMVDDDAVHRERQHPRWEGPYLGTIQSAIHLDLAWYEEAPMETQKRSRSMFRDAFFKAMCDCIPIVLHGTAQCLRSQREYRHVYTKDF